MPLNMKLKIGATKLIKLELGTGGTGGDDPRKQRVSAETYGGGVVIAAQVEGDNGGGVGCAVAGVGAIL
jgi:hypothetical protein